MTATNLFSVTSFGEFEYWFAGIKVVAIIGFLVLGSLFVFGIGRQGADFSNLTAHGGFLPNGFGRLRRHRGGDLLDGGRRGRHDRCGGVRDPGGRS